jgi:tetratricopeptide (TPR) repeat protein
MKPWAFLLSLALASSPSFAQQKEKDKKDQKKPDKPPAALSAEDLIKEAEAKASAGDADGAIETLRKAAAMPGPGAGEATLRLGRLLEERFEIDNAIDAYKAAAEKLTGTAKGEALGRLAVAQDLRGSSEVLASAEAATAADASGVWPTIALARARARQGNADEAIALAQKAAGAGGGAAAQAALGLAQETKGDVAAAEAAYRAGLAADAKSASSTLGLARVLRKTGRAAEAEPLLAKVIADAPGAVEAYKESARVKMALNRPQDAMGDAATAAAMAEQDPDAQSLVQEVTVAKALASAAQGQTDIAIQDLTALRDQNPNSAVARLGLGKALIIKRQPDAALVELQKAVELDPKNAEAWYQLGFGTHVLKQNAAGALPAYEKAVAADPGNPTYRTYLGAVLAETGQVDRAVAELTKVTTSPGYNKADAWIYLGGAQLGAKKYKEAIEALNKAVAVAPQSAQAEAYLGWAYFGLKDAAGFKEHAGKARTLGWKDAQLLDRLKRVEAGEAIK